MERKNNEHCLGEISGNCRGNQGRGCGNSENAEKHPGGKSSFHMHDVSRIFREMGLREGEIFVDLGCGPGDYSLYASEIVGKRGAVYALDRSEKCIEALQERVRNSGRKNLRVIWGDLEQDLPLEQDLANCTFLSTVLHSMDLSRKGDSLFREIRRILVPSGRLVIVECKKERTPFGPPEHLRLASEFLEEYCLARGFRKQKYLDLGHTYMIEFTQEGGPSSSAGA